MGCYNSGRDRKLQLHFLNTTPWLNECFAAAQVTAPQLDALLAGGWRHFGSLFFRYSAQHAADGALQTIMPLRIELARFTPGKSQRRVLRRNADIRWEVIPARAGDDVQALFHSHKQRFKDNVPDSIFDFIAPGRPGVAPCPCLEFRALAGGELVAASFLALGETATSSIYAVFDPAHAARSLGTLTLLKEIEFSRARGCHFLYPGYATREPGAYDYKKRFAATQALDWADGGWHDLTQ
jgi:arginine-tRNA-protein transferase